MDPSKRRFKNSWRRIERAGIHLSAFQREWASIFADDTLTTVARYERDSKWFIAGVSVPPRIAERLANNSLALELGEYAYQLRSALDGLIWDAITFKQNGTEPSSNANRVEFPILNGNAVFKDCGFLKFPFPDKLRRWLERIQPNMGEKPKGDPDRGIPTAISDIHDLARFDRHRRLRIIAAVPTHLKFGIFSKPPAKIVARERIDTCDLFCGEYDFIRFQVETADGSEVSEMILKTEFAFQILLEDVQPFEDMDAGTQLGSYIAVAEYIASRFEEEFA